MKSLLSFLTLMLLSTLYALGAEIPADKIGSGHWNTLKTENGWFFYAIEEGGQIKLGHTAAAPTTENYAAYCWQIEGDATQGYTFRCLKYEEDPRGKQYITNPTSLVTNSAEVLLSPTPSRYYYTDNHQLQLTVNTSLYLAYYSQYYHTVRLHNSANYSGSKIIIGGISDWSVEAIIYGTDTPTAEGLDQTQFVPGGGVKANSGTNYYHGDTFYTLDTNFTPIAVSGYSAITILPYQESRTIKVYYNLSNNAYTHKTATGSPITGEDGVIWALDPKNYITNTSGNYTFVPDKKVWQMEMVVENTNKSGSDPCFNQWGSCILASGGDPLNTYYWNEFQVYQHAPTHNSPNTLNFKSNKGDGLDHIIAQGASVANKDYKVIVTYNGDKTYIIRTIMLDASGNETSEVYNNVWIAARQQNPIHQLSCALPTGLNLKSLRISIAEESNLLEGIDYAIQNHVNEHYLNGSGTVNSATTSDWHSLYAGDAAKYQIEWTHDEDLTYSETDGGLHHSFYIKVGNGQWLGSDNTIVSSREQAQAFVYSTANKVHPILEKNKPLEAWTINTDDTWDFDFFANFYVEVAGNIAGGLKYRKNGANQIAKNGEYIELPSSVKVEQLANSSQLGYRAAISKADIRLRVQYTPLDDTFYHFTEKSTQTQTLYYWYKPQQKLVSCNAQGINSQGGKDVTSTWGEMGDCSLWTILPADDIPYLLHQNNMGTDADQKYYGTLYYPNAIQLPSGAEAFIVTGTFTDAVDNYYYKLTPIEGHVVPHHTPAIIISDSNVNSLQIDRNDQTAPLTADNLLSGLLLDALNSSYVASPTGSESSDVYVLSGKEGIGFYPYVGEILPAFRAYYNASAAHPSQFRFSFGDEETSITAPRIDSEQLDAEPVIFNLMGQRVSNPTSGNIYIINGKRTIIK